MFVLFWVCLYHVEVAYFVNISGETAASVFRIEVGKGYVICMVERQGRGLWVHNFPSRFTLKVEAAGSSKVFIFTGQNKPKTGSVALFKSNAWNQENQYWLLHFHAADCSDCYLLGFPSIETCRWIPVLQKNMLSPSSGFPLPWALVTTFLIIFL